MSTGGDVEYLTCMGKARVGQHLVSLGGGKIWGWSLPGRPEGRFPSLPEGRQKANRRPVSQSAVMD